MKKFFIIILWLLTLSGFSQIPINDECQNAIELPILNSLSWYNGDVKNSTPTYGIHLTDSVCVTWNANGKDVWFTFVANETNSRLFFKTTVPGFVRQLFKGNGCDTMGQRQCFNLAPYPNIVDSILLGPLAIGERYYIRIGNRQNGNLPSYPFEVSLKKSGIRNFIVSKLSGGVWDVPATWVGNLVPTNQDSVEITEGSTVKSPTFQSVAFDCRWLKIGGSDSTKKAIFNQRSGQSCALGLVLGKGDSIISRVDNGQYNANGVFFSVSASCTINGGINAKIVTLRFRGNSILDFTGTGTIVQNLFGGFTHENRGTTNFNFGGNLQSSLSLRYGTLRFLKPMVFKLRALPPGPFGEEPNYIEKFAGTYEGPLTFEMPVDFIWQNARIKYRYGLPASGSGYTSAEDTLSGPGKEFLNTKAMRVVTIERANKNRMFTFDSTLSLSMLQCLKGKIRMKNPSDTVFAHQTIMYGDSANNGYLTQGHICLWQDPNFGVLSDLPTDNSFALSKNGKVRYGNLIGNWFTVAGQKICPEIIPNPPSGSVVAPLTTIGGHSVLYIPSSRPIPAGQLKLRLYLQDDDYLLANPLDKYVAQAPTPNGPWKAVSQPVNNTFATRSTDPINFDNGRYFCWATSSEGADMALTAIICPPKYFQTGCPDSPNQTVGVAVQNKSVASVESFALSYQMGNGEIKTRVITYPINARLAPLKKDTLWFSNDLGQSITTADIHTFTAWVQMNGDSLKANDTLRATRDYRVQAFPYFNTFDTIKLQNSQFPLLRNIPYRWYDSINYSYYLKAGSGSMQITSGKYFAISTDFGNRMLESFGMIRPSDHSQYTNRIGPIQKPALLELKFAVGFFSGNPISIQDMETGDTIFVEGSEDCGYSWKAILKIHRGNRPLTEKLTFLRDSLTFSNGSTISLRIRTHFVGGIMAPLVRIDSVRLYQGVLVGNEKELVSNQEIQVYPNPGSGQLEVLLSDQWSQNASYQLFNLHGQMVQEGKLEENHLEIHPHISGGLYWLRLKSGEKIAGKKLILDR